MTADALGRVLEICKNWNTQCVFNTHHSLSNDIMKGMHATVERHGKRPLWDEVSLLLKLGLVPGNCCDPLDQPRHDTTSCLSVRGQWSGARATKALEKTPLRSCAQSAV